LFNHFNLTVVDIIERKYRLQGLSSNSYSKESFVQWYLIETDL